MQIITIDGPASSGKGTVARAVAEKLGFHYLESGAIYRAVALLMFEVGVDSHRCENDKEECRDDIGQVLGLIRKMDLKFNLDGTVILNGMEVAASLRQEKIGMLASRIAALPQVRDVLLKFQRDFAILPGLVTDGRDMGSVVFPNATLKVFLTANAEVRADRRWRELQSNGKSATIAAVLDDIVCRDKADSERASSPLVYDDSFVFLDNSKLSIDETVSYILSAYLGR